MKPVHAWPLSTSVNEVVLFCNMTGAYCLRTRAGDVQNPHTAYCPIKEGLKNCAVSLLVCIKESYNKTTRFHSQFSDKLPTNISVQSVRSARSYISMNTGFPSPCRLELTAAGITHFQVEDSVAR